HNGRALLLHKHVLGAAQADTLSSKGDGALGIAWIVGIGPDTQAAECVGPVQQLLEVNFFVKVGFDRLDDARKNFTGSAINGDVVAFFDHGIRANNAEQALFFADTNAFAASDTGQTKSACYHSCVAGSAAACCQDTLSNEHPMHIIRASLRAYQE